MNLYHEISPAEYVVRYAVPDSRVQNIIDNWCGFQNIRGKSYRCIPDVSPAFTIGRRILGVPSGTVYVSDWLISILTQKELEWVVLHELAHINNDHITGQLIGELLKFGGLAYLVFELNWPIKFALLGLEVLRSIIVGVTGSITENQELEADRIASYTQGTAKYGISALWKISGGNIDFVTHVAKGFIFQGPYLTIKKRIELLQSYR